jgi:hypothetical protein
MDIEEEIQKLRLQKQRIEEELLRDSNGNSDISVLNRDLNNIKSPIVKSKKEKNKSLSGGLKDLPQSGVGQSTNVFNNQKDTNKEDTISFNQNKPPVVKGPSGGSPSRAFGQQPPSPQKIKNNKKSKRVTPIISNNKPSSIGPSPIGYR